MDLNGTVRVENRRDSDPEQGGIRIALALRGRGLHPEDTLVGTVRPDGTFQLPKVYPDGYGLRLENLPPGHYLVRASQGGRDVLTAEVRPDAGVLTVDLGADGPVLSGRVLRAEGEEVPVPECTVFLIPRSGGPTVRVQTDQSGAFIFVSGVGPGDYRLVAVAGLPETERVDPASGLKFVSRATDVSLLARERKTVQLKAAEPR